MKGNKKQREKDPLKIKTESPHSIGASTSTKVSNLSKKSQAIQKTHEKSSKVQSKLIPIKNENGTKTLFISKASTSAKVHETRPSKSSSVVAAAQVELKKTVDPKLKTTAKEQKSNTPKATVSNSNASRSVSCKHCNLHFSNQIWLKKHIEKCHANESSLDEKPKSVDPKVKILKYKKQLDDIQKTLEKKSVKEKSKKKSKISPTKQKLRSEIKSQLAAQQKLLQVQQEIFEKATKAQQDIVNLISKLEDDSEDNEEDEEEASEDETSMANIKSDALNQNEVYLENVEGELIVAENSEEYSFMPQNYEIEEELITDDNNYMILNNQNMVAEPDQEDKARLVLISSGNDEEEFELIDVVEDQMYENSQIDENGDIVFEVLENDNNSLHCRIVTNEAEEPVEEVEYVDVQIDQKLPVKIDVGKISQIAQKRFSKLDAEKKADDDGTDSKVLNSTIHRSEKQTNEYIQKVVQNAVPTDDNKFECPICHEMVSNRYSLGPHILRLHSKQKSKICQYCDRSFTCTGDLTRHVRIHTGEKPFKCTFANCTYAFRASGDLHKHMRRHNSTTTNIRQHVCQLCGRAFERNYDLKRHELTHKKNEEGVGYTCEFCSKRFVRKDQHKAHVYRHLGIKQYKCPDCDRRFSDFSNCSKHIQQCQAGDVKPFGLEDNGPLYICEICNKRFKSKVGMKQHVIKCAQITELQKKLQDSYQQMGDE